MSLSGALGDQVLMRGGVSGDVAFGAALIQGRRQAVAQANLMKGQGLGAHILKLIIDGDASVQGAVVQIGAGDLSGQEDFGVAQAPDRSAGTRSNKANTLPARTLNSRSCSALWAACSERRSLACSRASC